MNKDRLCDNCKGYQECRLGEVANSLRANNQTDDYIEQVLQAHSFYAECESARSNQVIPEESDALAISPSILIEDPADRASLTESLIRYSANQNNPLGTS